MTTNVLSNYVQEVNKGATASLLYLKNNHKLIKKLYGKQAFKECMLNHRIHFCNNQEKVYKKIQSIVNIKKKYHKSDLAALWNYNKKYGLNDKLYNLMLKISLSLGLTFSINKKEYILNKIHNFFNKGNK